MMCGPASLTMLSCRCGRALYHLTDAAEKQSRYPGLKIGDLTTPNNNAGNWE